MRGWSRSPVEFDQQGRLWNRSDLGLSRREWPWPTPTLERVDVALPDRWMPFAVGTDAVYAFGDEVVYRITESGQTRIELPGVSGASDAVINHNNTIALAFRGTDEVMRLELGRDQPQNERMETEFDSFGYTDPLAIDERGRIWVPTQTAQWVFTPGAAPMKYGFGSVPFLVPLLGSGVTQVVVVGRGPELPSVQPSRRSWPWSAFAHRRDLPHHRRVDAACPTRCPVPGTG